MPKGHFISYLKERRLDSKVCVYNFAWVNDSSVETPPIELVPVVSEFFRNLSKWSTRVPPERDIDFDISILLDSHPISIMLYRMAPVESKELKHILDIVMIGPSVSPLHPGLICEGEGWFP